MRQRNPGLKTDYRGATFRQVGLAVLRYRPLAKQRPTERNVKVAAFLSISNQMSRTTQIGAVLHAVAVVTVLSFAGPAVTQDEARPTVSCHSKSITIPVTTEKDGKSHWGWHTIWKKDVLKVTWWESSETGILNLRDSDILRNTIPLEDEVIWLNVLACLLDP